MSLDLVGLSALPGDLVRQGAHYADQFAQALADKQLAPVAIPENTLATLFACSDFIAKTCIRRPEMLGDLVATGDLTRAYSENHYHQFLSHRTRDINEQAQLSEVFRHIRQREMVRIAWRDIAGAAELSETLRELSWLAEACVQVATDKMRDVLTPQFGAPRNAQGELVEMTTLGMGKLGAYELNYSSDIDLIFTFAEEGETSGGRMSISNGEFFVKLAQRIAGLLNETTAEGFVFRVDTRLRPFGDSGALALSFDAMESYYERHGREWERYAMIKARVISKDKNGAGAELMQRLHPFIYRRYLDFGAFESIREMKKMIAAELARKSMDDNIKLGAGGIREIEFIGQAFQLIRGGREKRLQERSIIAILTLLAELSLLPAFVVQRLIDAYRFLRRAENRLQAIADKQTHILPNASLDQARLATMMGFSRWEDFMVELDAHRQLVHEHFDQVFGAPQAEERADKKIGSDESADLWQGVLSQEQAQAVLQKLGYKTPLESYQLIVQFKDGASCRALGQKGRERMNMLMPMAIGACARLENSATSLVLIIRLFEAIARRTAYLALLVENPVALSQLVRLVGKSPWIADLLARYPLLLDELLDPRRLYEVATREALFQELAVRMLSISADDVEQQMDTLRQFKQANALRVAAAELTGAMAVSKVSDHLTFIAEAVLNQVYHLTFDYLVERHGRPLNKNQQDAGFGIVAYGKLGGLELGFGSDLDIIFLHNSELGEQTTGTDKSVENSMFFARLAQRIIHLLNTHTVSGVLYDVDTRLRPSGASGLLVSNMESFLQYQQKEAWVWEHQALVRARFVAGSAEIEQRFNAIRSEILCQPREPATLRQAVMEMRTRMRAELVKASAGQFDLKQGTGGITDIEFMTQYLLLRWAHDYPALIHYSDNLRQLDSLADANLLSQENAKMLQETYLAYRHKVHELTLQNLPAMTAETEFSEQRANVSAMWNTVFAAD